MHRSRTILLIAFGTVLLLCPALFNRAPFVFYDTTHYLQTGKAVLAAAHIPLPSIGTGDDGPAAASPKPAAVPAPAAIAKPPPRAAPVHMSLTYIGGRSPYYSAPLALVVGLIGLWPIAIAQAAVGSWLGWLAVRLCTAPGTTETRGFVLLIAVLTAASSLPYFASYAMPDIFGGYAVAATVLLLARGPWGHGTRLGLWVLALFAGLAHATNPLLVWLTLLIGGATLFVALRDRRGVWRRIALPGSAAVAMLMGGPIFSLACTVLLGEPPHSPPYLMARVMEDGPGRAYLPVACRDPSRYAICAFRDRRLDDHDEILWSTDPTRGVFNFADYPTRLRLAREERSFVLHAVMYAPTLWMTAAFRNWMDQLGMIGLTRDVGATRRSWLTILHVALPHGGALLEHTRSYAGTMPFAAIDALIGTGLALSGVFTVYRLSRADLRERLRRRPRDLDGLVPFAIAGGLLVLILFNAALCGILSGPSERYQLRLLWLVPAYAVLLGLRLGIRPGSRLPSGTP